MLHIPHGMNIYSSSRLSVFNFYKGNNLQAAADAYASWIKLITVMGRFSGIMSGTQGKGCTLINSANHCHVYNLLNEPGGTSCQFQGYRLDMPWHCFCGFLYCYRHFYQESKIQLSYC